MSVNKHVLVSNNGAKRDSSSFDIQVVGWLFRIISFIFKLPFILISLGILVFFIIQVAPALGYAEFAESLRSAMLVGIEKLRELLPLGLG